MAIIAILIKRDSKGPALYRGVRVGQDSRLFKMLKFRTMVANAEKMGASSTADDDPRITRVGQFLRKYTANGEVLDFFPSVIERGEKSNFSPFGV